VSLLLHSSLSLKSTPPVCVCEKTACESDDTGMMGTYRKFDFTLNSCSAYTAFDRESSGGDDDEYEKVTGYYMATCSDDVVTVTSYSDSACSSSDSVFTFDGGEVVF
jgi:hypothetical protein